MYNEITGNLITLAQTGEFNVIVHGCNCFCTMKRGIAPQMDKAFGCNNPDIFLQENNFYKGDIKKLGNIEGRLRSRDGSERPGGNLKEFIIVVNAYTQYHWDTATKPFDYHAFILICKKLNKIYEGKHIGMPRIGSHLAGGDWEQIKEIIQKELKDVNVTIVNFQDAV